jgi:hypothetical protein
LKIIIKKKKKKKNQKSKIKVFPASIDRGRPSSFGVAGVCSTREFAVVGWQAPLLAFLPPATATKKERIGEAPMGSVRGNYESTTMASSRGPVDCSVRRK